MSKKKKNKEIEEYEEQILNIVKENMLEGRAVRDSGQLKFLKSQLTRHLAISTNLSAGTKTALVDYLKTNFLKNKEEIAAFFDKKRNVEILLESYHGNLMSDISERAIEGRFPRVILLQKAQSVMEQALCYYMNLSFEDELNEIDDYKEEIAQKRKEEAKKPKEKQKQIREIEYATTKKKAYLKFLYSISIYEMFIINEYEELDGEFLYEKGEIGILYARCLLCHLTNLYAMIRVLYFIEFVHSNGGFGEEDTYQDDVCGVKEKTNKERNGRGRSVLYRKAYEETKHWGEGIENLFCSVDRKGNLGKLYQQLDETYFRIFTEEEKKEYKGVLAKYLEMIQHPLEQRTLQEEEQLQALRIKIAGPIWNAVGEIKGFQARAGKE